MHSVDILDLNAGTNIYNSSFDFFQCISKAFVIMLVKRGLKIKHNSRGSNDTVLRFIRLMLCLWLKTLRNVYEILRHRRFNGNARYYI